MSQDYSPCLPLYSLLFCGCAKTPWPRQLPEELELAFVSRRRLHNGSCGGGQHVAGTGSWAISSSTSNTKQREWSESGARSWTLKAHPSVMHFLQQGCTHHITKPHHQMETECSDARVNGRRFSLKPPRSLRKMSSQLVGCRNWRNCFPGFSEALTLRSVLLCLLRLTAFLDCHKLHGTRKRDLGL